MSPREQIAAIAQAMLDGRTELHAGCRELCALQSRLSKPDTHSADFVMIVAIDSALDDHPLGAARQLWSRPALAEKDRERDEYLRRNGDQLAAALRALATWR